MRLIDNGEMIGGCMIGRLGVYRTVYFVYGSVRLVFSYFLFCVRCFCFQISPFSCFSSFFMQSVFFHGINRVLQIISGKKLRRMLHFPSIDCFLNFQKWKYLICWDKISCRAPNYLQLPLYLDTVLNSKYCKSRSEGRESEADRRQ